MPHSHSAPSEGCRADRAGDAYRGAYFGRHSAGMPVDVCGRVGALCATYVLEESGTTNHRFTPQEFAIRYEQTFGEELLWGEPT